MLQGEGTCKWLLQVDFYEGRACLHASGCMSCMEKGYGLPLGFWAIMYIWAWKMDHWAWTLMGLISKTKINAYKYIRKRDK